MNHVIVTMADKENYGPLVEPYVWGIRDFGRFKGDIFVISDGDWSHLGQDVHSVKPEGGKWYLGLKPRCIKDIVKNTGCDRVMFIDVDVLVVRRLEDFFVGGGVFICSEEPSFSMTRSSFSGGWSDFRGLFRAAEGRTGFNCGILVCDGSVAEEYMDMWAEEIEALKPKGGRAQTALNKLALEGSFRCESMGTNAVSYPVVCEKYGIDEELNRMEQATFLHLCGLGPKVAFERMRLINAVLRGVGRA